MEIPMHRERERERDPRKPCQPHGHLSIRFVQGSPANVNDALTACSSARSSLASTASKDAHMHGGSIHGGTPKWMVYSGQSHSNGWFRGTSIYRNLHMHPYASICSMVLECARMFINMYPQNHLQVGKYTIHRASEDEILSGFFSETWGLKLEYMEFRNKMKP